MEILTQYHKEPEEIIPPLDDILAADKELKRQKREVVANANPLKSKKMWLLFGISALLIFGSNTDIVESDLLKGLFKIGGVLSILGAGGMAISPPLKYLLLNYQRERNQEARDHHKASESAKDITKD